MQSRRSARLSGLVGAGRLAGRLAVLALVGAAVAGCASNCTGDPKTDNVWCADKGLNDGLYADTLKEKEQALADQQRKVASERATGKQLRERLAALKTRRLRIERELSALQARLTRMGQQKGAQQARIAGLRAEIAKAQDEQRAARIRLDEQLRRVESGKALETSVKTAVAVEKAVLDEEASVLSDERGMRLLAQQVDEVTRT